MRLLAIGAYAYINEEKRKVYIEKITNRLNGYSLEELRKIFDFMTYKLR